MVLHSQSRSFSAGIRRAPTEVEMRVGRTLLKCSTPHEFNPAQVRLSIMESSRTSNGLNRKAVRHPCGTLINYIFIGSKVSTAIHMKRGRNHTVNRNRV